MSDSDTDQTGAITPTPAEREALRAAIAKATPGPWRVVSEDEDRYSVGALTAQDRIRFVAEECREFADADAHAIALAVNLAGPLDAALTAETARADAAERDLGNAAHVAMTANSEAVRYRKERDEALAEARILGDDCHDGECHACARCYDSMAGVERQTCDERNAAERVNAIRATALDSSARLVAAADQAVRDGLLISTLRAEAASQEKRAVALSRTLLDVLRHGVGLPESIANDVRAALGGAR